MFFSTNVYGTNANFTGTITGGTFSGNGAGLTNIPLSSLTRSTNSMSATNLNALNPYSWTNQTAALILSTNILNYTPGTDVVVLNCMYVVSSGGPHAITVPAHWLDISSVGNPIYNTNRGRLGIEIWPGIATNYVWSGN
jgi:hypothetical protein